MSYGLDPRRDRAAGAAAEIAGANQGEPDPEAGLAELLTTPLRRSP